VGIKKCRIGREIRKEGNRSPLLQKKRFIPCQNGLKSQISRGSLESPLKNALICPKTKASMLEKRQSPENHVPIWPEILNQISFRIASFFWICLIESNLSSFCFLERKKFHLPENSVRKGICSLKEEIEKKGIHH
jgi:hypothetical protein